MITLLSTVSRVQLTPRNELNFLRLENFQDLLRVDYIIMGFSTPRIPSNTFKVRNTTERASRCSFVFDHENNSHMILWPSSFTKSISKVYSRGIELFVVWLTILSCDWGNFHFLSENFCFLYSILYIDTQWEINLFNVFY